MKRILVVAIAALVAMAFAARDASAISKQYLPKKSGEKTFTEQETKIEKAAEKESHPRPEFPEKGWHKGPYIAAHGGFMQATNDTNLVTNRKFDGSIIPAVGLTFGWDIADWIGPMLQMTYGFASGTVGDGATADTPVENAREHALNFSLFCRATLPYFTRAGWQPNSVKFIPYLKLGGTGHALYVHANGDGNKVGAWGGGLGVGGGLEFFVWKGLFFAIDFTENIIFQQAYRRTVNGVPNTEVTSGGTKFQANVLGLVGWHF